ncbi:hypothetical protein V8F33_011369 [Rhypophila sp. PSN 637]
MICGGPTQTISFNELAQASMTFDFLNLYIGIGPRLPLDRFTIFQLLLRHRWCEATDPRDKVYSLCGIASDAKKEERHLGVLPDRVVIYITESLGLVLDQPDYGVSTVEAFTRVAANLITSDVGLNLFSAIHLFSKSIDELPSWFFHLEQQNPFSSLVEKEDGSVELMKNKHWYFPPEITGLEKELLINKTDAVRLQYLLSAGSWQYKVDPERLRKVVIELLHMWLGQVLQAKART